eukprot:TRINITY_DN3532_c0_g1_i1.p1 TRINITY_DN3532_c0_g1~~TRINITY_DN3532_c0_g1_i1.p1  ORF type:complete len:1494 (+),score=331.22 TRINITY_DN3532_c0_g1_i1:283-4482(+)
MVRASETGILAFSMGVNIHFWNLDAKTYLGTTLKGHRGKIVQLCLSSDGEHVYSYATDRMLIRWTIQTKEEVSIKMKNQVSSMVLCGSRNILFLGYDNGEIALFNEQKLDLMATWKGHGDAVSALAVREDREHMYSGSPDGVILKWDLSSGRVMQTLSSEGVEMLYWDAQVLLSATKTRITLWNEEAGLAERVYEVPKEEEIRCVGQTGGIIYHGNVKGEIQGWALLPQPRLCTWPLSNLPLLITSDGRGKLLLTNADGTLDYYDPATGSAHHYGALQGDIKGVVKTPWGWAALSADQLTWFTVAEGEASLTILKKMTLKGGDWMPPLGGHNIILISDKEIWSIDGSQVQTRVTVLSESVTCACSNDEGDLLFVANDQGEVILWKKKQLGGWGHTLTISVKNGTSSPQMKVTALACTQSADYLFVGNNLGSIQVYRLQHGKMSLVKTLIGEHGSVTCMAVGEGVLVSGSGEGRVYQWQYLGEATPLVNGEAPSIMQVCMGLPGEVIALTSDSCLQVWTLLNFPASVNVKALDPSLSSPELEQLLREDREATLRLVGTFGDYDRIERVWKDHGQEVTYYLIRSRRWTLLRKLGATEDHLDVKSLRYLSNRVSMGDLDTIERVFGIFNISQGILDIVAGTSSDHWDQAYHLLKRLHWPLAGVGKDGRTVLHHAVAKGSVEVVNELLQEPEVDVGKRDELGRYALHEVYRLSEDPSEKTDRLKLRRLECAKTILEGKDRSKTRFLKEDANHKSVYQNALHFHAQEMDRIAQDKNKGLAEEAAIARGESIILASAQIIQLMNEQGSVKHYRQRFAVRRFLALAIHYFLFLGVLTAVAFELGNVSQDNWQFVNNLNQIFGGTPWNVSPVQYLADIQAPSDFWTYMQGPFLAGVFPSDGNAPGFISQYNVIIGGIRMKQIRLDFETCSNVPIKGVNISQCVSTDVDAESTSSFGPASDGSLYRWTDDGQNDAYWGRYSDGKFPKGGFVVDLQGNQSQVASTLAGLQGNGWISPQTRAILIAINVYNINIQKYGIIRLSVERLPASGSLLAYSEIRMFGKISTLVQVLQIVLAVYVCIEFVMKEFFELFRIIRSPDARILQDYVYYVWNWLEWLSIGVFVAIIWLEILYTSTMRGIQYPPPMHNYINLSSSSVSYGHLQDLKGVFTALCWLRLLKLLQLLPLTGPIIQSILDTFKEKIFLVFTSIFIGLLWIFSILYSLSFPDTFDFRNLSGSFMSVYGMAFGNFDYDELRISNRVMAPLLFVLFFFFTNIVFLNMFIAIITELYTNLKSKKTLSGWEWYITQIMIDYEVHDKKEFLEVVFNKVGACLHWLRRGRRLPDVHTEVVKGLHRRAQTTRLGHDKVISMLGKNKQSSADARMKQMEARLITMEQELRKQTQLLQMLSTRG